MKFRTELKPTPFAFNLDPNCPVITLGSCFAEEIASKMRSCGWRAENPFGTLFNPESIANVFDLVLTEDNNRFNKFIFQDRTGIYHSWFFGSRFSSESEQSCIEKFREATDHLLENLKNSEALFVTFGTAWVYSLKEPEEGLVVGNCHKEHPDKFKRFRLSVDQILDRWEPLITRINELYPALKIIFTVSPVRHLKDGFHENTISKAILHLAIEELVNSFDFVFYFPAFELLNDDLRGYRFYSDDLVHPSDTAVNYIWEAFIESFLDQRGKNLVKEGEREIKRLNHRTLITN